MRLLITVLCYVAISCSYINIYLHIKKVLIAFNYLVNMYIKFCNVFIETTIDVFIYSMEKLRILVT